MSQELEYAMKLDHENGGTYLIVWQFRKSHGWSLHGNFDVPLRTIASLYYKKYKELITKGDWIYFTFKEADKLMGILDLPRLGELECSTCNKNHKGYIPLSSFYTGCPNCNSGDDGRYTFFEITLRNAEKDTESG